MKRVITLIVALLMTLGYRSHAVAQGSHANNKNAEKKILVAYFSYSGVTKRYAEKIAELSGAKKIFVIEPAQPYTKEDIDWTREGSRVNQEMKAHPDSRPALARKLDNPQDYDLIFLGFPIWWYIAPNIINSFLETHDLAGKIIVPFFTSGSSGPGETDKHLHKSINYSVSWKPATRVNRMTDRQLQTWVEQAIK